ncbi:MAG: M50 family metallopeptidase [Candidatus Dependentiae bacterium]|nr:M50 family metallopeptidase [Candidatus Dependentiae bacterium]
MLFIESVLNLSRHILFIALGISGIGFLIGFHELGHFLFCKLFGIATPSFSIGMGPKIISKKIGETEFSLSLLPLGGYVEIAGAAEVGQGDQKEAYSVNSDSFATKPFYQKLLVMLGGIAFNLLFAYIVITCLFLSKPTSTFLFPSNATPTISAIAKDSAAEKGGLQAGDTLISIDHTTIANNIHPFLLAIQNSPEVPTTITVKRDQEILQIPITPDSTTHPNTHKTIGTLGITAFKPIASCSILEAVKRGITQTNMFIVGTGRGLINIITQKNFSSMTGPIGIIALGSGEAAKGMEYFFFLLALISISLAIFNLIPLPIFDGGQILFYAIEALIGRPLSPTIREYIHMATWLLVLALIVGLSIRDITRIASPHIETTLQFLGLRK